MLQELLHFHGTWRTYQQRVLDRFDKYGSDKKIHVVAAPGSGKTTLGIELVRRLDAAALILAPTITIREQWADRIRESFLPQDDSREDAAVPVSASDTASPLLSQDLKNPGLNTIAT